MGLSCGRCCCRLLFGLSFRECLSLNCLCPFGLVWTEVFSPAPRSDGQLHNEREGPCRSKLPRLYFTTVWFHHSGMRRLPSGHSSLTSKTGLRQCRRPAAKLWLTQAFGPCGPPRGRSGPSPSPPRRPCDRVRWIHHEEPHDDHLELGSLPQIRFGDVELASPFLRTLLPTPSSSVRAPPMPPLVLVVFETCGGISSRTPTKALEALCGRARDEWGRMSGSGCWGTAVARNRSVANFMAPWAEPCPGGRTVPMLHGDACCHYQGREGSWRRGVQNFFFRPAREEGAFRRSEQTPQFK